jgi:hypothetical protein
MFVRSQREEDIDLYVQAIEKTVWLFFSHDHQNYARSASQFLIDLKSLPESILNEFRNKGNWVVNKTQKHFSSIPFDQFHEMKNKELKGTGGIIGLTDDPVALQRWLITGPLMTKLMDQFEELFLPQKTDDLDHHEEGFSRQQTFQKEVNQVVSVIEKLGNPFGIEHEDLISVDTHNCFDRSVVESVYAMEKLGKKQYKEFCHERLVTCTKSIHDPIPKNNLKLMKTKVKKVKTKEGVKVQTLKNNVELFGSAVIALSKRQCDLKEFFKHEAQKWSPAISDLGDLLPAKNKSDVISCIVPEDQRAPPDLFDTIVIDGAAMVHFLSSGLATTFTEYFDQIVLAYLLQLLLTTDRLDLVFDLYKKNSLKSFTRASRGAGVRRKVGPSTKLPKDWANFLRVDKNKEELFEFIAKKIAVQTFPTGKIVCVTAGDNVLSPQGYNMPTCNHEEADSRIFVHVKDSLMNGAKQIQIRTVDSDLVVIASGLFPGMRQVSQLEDIWISFGVGKHFKNISIASIVGNIGEEKSIALPFWTTFTGCDTVSQFRAKGKKTAWKTWTKFSAVTNTFRYFAEHPFRDISEPDSLHHLQVLERYVILLFSSTCESMSIDEARLEMFSEKRQNMEALPPTRDSLMQHLKRAIFQCGIWTTATENQAAIPSPSSFGWIQEEESWQPQWITIPEISENLRKLIKIKCNCTGGCTSCSCGGARLPCTRLCHCGCPK